MKKVYLLSAVSILFSLANFAEDGNDHHDDDHGHAHSEELIPVAETLTEIIHESSEEGNKIWVGKSANDKTGKLHLDKEENAQENWVFDSEKNEYVHANPAYQKSTVSKFKKHEHGPYSRDFLEQAVEKSNELLVQFLENEVKVDDAHDPTLVVSAKIWSQYNEDTTHHSEEKVWLRYMVEHEHIKTLVYECDNHHGDDGHENGHGHGHDDDHDEDHDKDHDEEKDEHAEKKDDHGEEGHSDGDHEDDQHDDDELEVGCHPRMTLTLPQSHEPRF